MVRAVVACDPGGHWTGIVARHDNDLFFATTITRKGPMALYISQVLRAMIRAFAACPDRPIVAVEAVNDPSPHMGVIGLRGLLDTAQVLGAVLATYPAAIVVAPGGHGSAPLQCYPAQLIGAREKAGRGVAKHQRSAWDIARVGAVQERQKQLA